MNKINLAQLSPMYLRKWSQKTVAISIFLALCSNLIIASAIYAATSEAISRDTVYAIGLLLLVIFGLSIYLFVVIFQPERF